MVENLVPTEYKIKGAVKRLCNQRSGGLSGMRSEHLKRCLVSARKAAKNKTTARAEITEGKESTESTEITEPTEAFN